MQFIHLHDLYKLCLSVAQLVQHCISNPNVISSIPGTHAEKNYRPIDSMLGKSFLEKSICQIDKFMHSVNKKNVLSRS